MKCMRLKKLLLALLSLCLFLCSCSSHPNNTEENVSDKENTAEAIDVGSGLSITGLFSAAGEFPEDGSNTYVENILAATFFNSGEKTLQYAKVHVTTGENTYSFELTSLPPGKSLTAFELGMQSAPEGIQDISVETEYLVFFPEEPQLYAEQLEVTFVDGSINLKNISGQAITNEISLFFKNTYQGSYMGGITYRVRIGGLGVNEEVNAYSSYSDAESSELMFVTYGN